MYSQKKYINLLNRIQSENYRFSTNWGEHKDNIILMRHDVDFSVEYALELSKVEKVEGVTSTFFFMMSSNTYNFLSKKHIEEIIEIREMGHKISLHFDPTCYRDMESGFEIERNAFVEMLKVELDIVSIHIPGVFLEDNNRDLCGCAQTYQDKFFKKMKYISDSRGRDIFPPIEEFFKQELKTPLHLLIHPVWWRYETASQTATLDLWLGETLDFIRSETHRNCDPYEG